MTFALGTFAWMLGLASATVAPPVTAVAFAPDGKEVVAGSQAGVEVRTWPELTASRKLDTQLANVHDAAFSPSGKWLALAGGAPAETGEIELLEWPAGKPAKRLAVGSDVVYSVAWSADSRWLAAGDGTGAVSVYEVATGERKLHLRGHAQAVLAVTFLPAETGEDRPGLVSAGLDQSVRVWSSRGELQRTLANHTAAVLALALRPTAEARPLVASIGRDKTVRLWQPTIGRLVRFARLSSEPVSLAWSTDGARLLVGCADGKVRSLDPDSLEIQAETAALEGWVYGLAPAPAGEAVASGSAGQVVRVRLH